MSHKIIFISHPIRSACWESDMQAIRDLFVMLRKQCRHQEIPEYLTAAYLLHAQTLHTHALLVDYRLSYANCPCGHGAVDHHELHLYGDDVTDEMIAEASASAQRGKPVLIKSDAIKCNPLAQSFVSSHACAA